MDKTLVISFDETTEAEANILAQSLQQFLEFTESQSCQLVKEDPDTMDQGTLLMLVLQTGAVLSIARGISVWLRKNQDKKITIKTQDGEIDASGLSSDDIKGILDKINRL